MFAPPESSDAPLGSPESPPPVFPQPAPPQVISVSRRTDIPACYPDWFMARLRAGWVRSYHPFTGAAQDTPLSREQVVAFAFWTHDCGPFLKHLSALDRLGYAYYFLHTLTALPKTLEPRLPPPDLVLRSMRELASRVGPHRLHWRYDPILIAEGLDEQYHLRTFPRLARALEGSTRRVIVSFVYPYARVKRRLENARLGWQDPAPERKAHLLERLAESAREHGMTLVACCPDYPLPPSVQRAHCIDPETLSLLRPDVTQEYALAPTRRGCGCARSFDIGAYDTCAHGCLYCYATSRPVLAQRRAATHDPSSPSLLP